MDYIELQGVIYTASDEMTTDHTAWLTFEDAEVAGGQLASEVWIDAVAGDADSADQQYFERADHGTRMDMVRTHAGVRLEIEPVTVRREVVRAAIVEVARDEADEFYADVIADLLKAAHADGHDFELVARVAQMNAEAEIHGKDEE